MTVIFPVDYVHLFQPIVSQQTARNFIMKSMLMAEDKSDKILDINPCYIIFENTENLLVKFNFPPSCHFCLFMCLSFQTKRSFKNVIQTPNEKFP